jgi:diguanylate cyclase (GGDEF)-like protein/PAS domain S-box-containing protein
MPLHRTIVLDMPQIQTPEASNEPWARLRAFFSPYTADEEDEARFRARQLQAVLRLTPIAMFVNVANAAWLCVALWHQASRSFLLSWALVVALMAALGFRGWYRAYRRPPRATASPRATRRATIQAAALGLIWATLPVVTFPTASSDGRFFIGMVTTGMICAGGCMLAPIPWASTAFTLLVGAGAAYALASWPAPESAGATALLLFYVVTVVYAAWTLAKTLGARLQAEAHAARQSEVIGLLLRDVEDQSSDLLWELDAAGRFAKVSHRVALTLGSDPARLQGLRASTLLQRLLPRDEEAAALWAALSERLAGRAPFRDAVLHLAANGRQRWWSVSARPLLNASGRPAGWRGVATDITDKHVAHRRLKWLAHNDALTGLANRAQFHEHLRAALPTPPTAVAPIALVAFDLDGFKQTNDSHGHHAGDCLLQAFSARLRGVARRSDLVARLGGDEFAMVVRGVSSQTDIRPLLERICASLRDPLMTNGVRLSLRASMGVAFAPQDGQDVDALMNHADIALYAAKRAGGSRYHFFQAAMADANRRRSALEHALREAVQRQEMRLVYQPQITANARRLCGFEALLRWNHPELGEVPPTEFIGIAERSGLMPAIGAWVLSQACHEAHRWPGELTISVNVSATQLTAPGFVESVRGACGPLPIGRVELEITESALMDDADTAVAVLTALRGMGFRIALDDFGTGYSALGYLRLFRFDTLKIDKGFVRDLAANAEAQVIVDTILAMAGALKMATVAEGVETCEEAQLLEQRGCNVLQGYLIGRPMPPEDALAFIDSWPKTGERAG